jgi:hypothetical protein
MATVEGVVELPYITVDEPPGKEGYQAQHPDAEVPSVPHWEDGQNPPGTDPPTPPAIDPATVLPPGTDPFPVPEGAVAESEVLVEDTAPRTNPAVTEIPGTHPFPYTPQAVVAEEEFGLEECDDTDSRTD